MSEKNNGETRCGKHFREPGR